MSYRWLLAFPVVLVASLAFLRADKPVNKLTPINAVDIGVKYELIGALGHPLGTIVTIEGVVADGSFVRRKADDGQTLLRVQKVDGKKLIAEPIFQFHTRMDWMTPKAGAKFKYVGYETGSYTGIPNKAFEYIGALQSTGYGFTTEFAFLRDELNRK